MQRHGRATGGFVEDFRFRRRHFRSAETFDDDVRLERPEGADQLSGMLVAGHFGDGDEDSARHRSFTVSCKNHIASSEPDFSCHKPTPRRFAMGGRYVRYIIDYDAFSNSPDSRTDKGGAASDEFHRILRDATRESTRRWMIWNCFGNTPPRIA